MTVFLDGKQVTSIRILGLDGTTNLILNSATRTADVLHVLTSQSNIQIFEYMNDLITGKPIVLQGHQVVSLEEHKIIQFIIQDVEKAGVPTPKLELGGKRIKSFSIVNIETGEAILTITDKSMTDEMFILEFQNRISVYNTGTVSANRVVMVERRFVSNDLAKYVQTITSY